MKLWFGIEEEGLWKGFRTLFVGSPTITSNEIEQAIMHYNIQQVYFGAGKCTKINYNVVKDIISYKYLRMNELLITLEVKPEEFIDLQKSKTLLRNCYFIITYNNILFSALNKVNANCQIKLQTLGKNKSIHLFGCDNIMSVDLNKHIDKVYKKDIILK